MRVKTSHRKHWFRLNKQEKIDGVLSEATDAWLRTASNVGAKVAKPRFIRPAIEADEQKMPTILMEAKLLTFVGGLKPGDSRLPFASSLLRWIASRRNLTPKQEAAAIRMLEGKPRPKIPKDRQRRARAERRRRQNSDEGIVTEPSAPIEPYSGSDPPWAE